MKTFIYISLSLTATRLLAQSTWTFDDALLEMTLKHPSLREADSRVEASSTRIDYADVLPDPMVSVGRFIEPVQTRTGPQETVFQLSQSIPWFGVRDSQSGVAMAEAKVQERTRSYIRAALTRQLADTFYEYAYLEKAIGLTEENLRLLLELDPVVESKVAGGGALNALLRLKVESGMLEDQLKSLNAKKVLYSSRLDELLNQRNEGVRSWPTWQPPKKIALKKSDLSELLLAYNPSLLTQESNVTLAEAREKMVNAQSAPSFVFGVNYIQLGDPEVNPSTPDAGNDPWSVQAAILIPLWAGAEKSKQQEASINLQAQIHRRDTVLQRLQTELDTRLELHADAQRKLELYGNELIGLARQAVENSRAGYETDNTSLLELIDSERSLLALELQYWRAAADAHIHQLHIQTLTHPEHRPAQETKEMP